ncbi:MAG: hypothetical protein Q8R28_14150, partial [Dehalococcoidia bacterium]|nr:hypothetical protein [Dehalococcoidia bacterium]
DVNEYDLGPAWDISTAVHNQSFDWGASPATASGLFFKPDGTKMYITGLVDQRVYEYDLGTAWDVSTAVLTQSFFQTSGGSVTARDVFFKPDGTKMYVSDSNNEDVHEYDLSTAWDVSTAVFNQSFDVSNEDGESRGIFFKPDGTKMYVVGDDGNDVNEYDILSSPTILAWDERGWQVLWAEAEAGEDIDHLLVSSAYSEYRLWWGSNNLVYFMPLQRDISNPNQIPDYEYALEAETITPWFTAGQVEVDKLALRILAETIIGDAADSVTVSYGTDYSEAWTALTAITSSGKTEFTLPSTASPVGVAFRAIRFRIELARDNSSPASDKLRTPDLVSLTLEYRKKLPVKWGHSVTVSINGPHKGNTAKQLQAALKTAIDSKTLLEFAFHPNDASDESYFVDIAQVHGLEFSGRDYRGEISLMLVER